MAPGVDGADLSHAGCEESSAGFSLDHCGRTDEGLASRAHRNEGALKSVRSIAGRHRRHRCNS